MQNVCFLTLFGKLNQGSQKFKSNLRRSGIRWERITGQGLAQGNLDHLEERFRFQPSILLTRLADPGDALVHVVRTQLGDLGMVDKQILIRAIDQVLPQAIRTGIEQGAGGQVELLGVRRQVKEDVDMVRRPRPFGHVQHLLIGEIQMALRQSIQLILGVAQQLQKGQKERKMGASIG